MFEVPDQRIDDAQVDSLLASEEHIFLDRAYGVLLARAPDEHGRQHYLARLDGGASRISVLQDIAAGEEFSRRNLEVPTRLNRPPGSLAGHLRAALQATRRFWRGVFGHPAAETQARSSPIVSQLAVVDQRSELQPAEQVMPVEQVMPMPLCPPHPYVRILSPNYVCLHAAGVRLALEGYAQLEHIAEMTHADIVYADEWLMRGDGVATPKLREAYSPYSFVADPDMGGAIAVRRDLLDLVGIDECAPLTGDLLLQLVAHSHSIVHQQLLLSRRSVEDVAANRPSRKAWEAFAAKVGAKAEMDASGVRMIWTSDVDVRTAIVATSTSGDIVRPCAETFGKSPLSGAASALDSPTAAINSAVRRLPLSCDVILLTGIPQHLVKQVDLKQLVALAAREDVALAVPLVCTEAGRPAGGSWDCGPAGILRRRGRLESKANDNFKTPRFREVSLVDSAFFAIRRDLFLDLGGLDEHMLLLEAVFDLSLRARALNFRLIAVDDVILVSDEINIPSRLSLDDLSDRFKRRHGEQVVGLDAYSVLELNGKELDDNYHRDLLHLSFSAHRKVGVKPIS
ncbi:glycosyltransferase family 2 protein [Sphingomonas azotifigens]|uniref:glycosyltransferase family 2 protein n=1 Tax=Sphingomonas azotifigens TaxID=330920 RepID=UPI00142FC045|nr:DUF4214 domain-containing protein [Sphingomonas azotifigens]